MGVENYIYGAGIYGKKFLEISRNINIGIEAFIVTESVEDNNHIDEIPIISCKEFIDRCAGCDNSINVFIAIKNINESKKIKAQIEKTNERINAIICSGLIRENYEEKSVIQGKGTCLICGNKVDFLPSGIKSDIFSRHHIIGGGYREHAQCSYCHSLDRERWLYYVLKNKTQLFSSNVRVLHFAPEKALESILSDLPNIDYYTGDIMPGMAMHITDITDIQYKDETFDIIICNHVLEHIENEKKAVSEILRVLKPDGIFIFSFPICLDDDTKEDPTVDTREKRLEYYGQEDHVRLYGKDFKERFENYGMEIEIYSPADELSEEEIITNGFLKNDIIMIARKKDLVGE